MAYNLTNDEVKTTQSDLSTNMVDKQTDQEINGTKTFINGITAKNFTLADGTTLQPTALETITNNHAGAILVCNGDKTATAAKHLHCERDLLVGEHAIFKTIEASGKGIRDLQSNQLQGPIAPTLIPLRQNGALSVQDKKLTVDFTNVFNINLHGQTIADLDTILVYDASHNALRKTTLKNLYDAYLDAKMSRSGGHKGSLQFKEGKGFKGCASLTFDQSKKALRIDGETTTINLRTVDTINVGGALTCEGAIYQPITTVDITHYTVGATDSTILVDLTNNNVLLTLPDPAENVGRVLNIKAIHSKKYSLKSHTLTIQSASGTIDLFEEATLKMSRSSRVIQSDGENWWILSGRGS